VGYGEKGKPRPEVKLDERWGNGGRAPYYLASRAAPEGVCIKRQERRGLCKGFDEPSRFFKNHLLRTKNNPSVLGSWTKRPEGKDRRERGGSYLAIAPGDRKVGGKAKILGSSQLASFKGGEAKDLSEKNSSSKFAWG